MYQRRYHRQSSFPAHDDDDDDDDDDENEDCDADDGNDGGFRPRPTSVEKSVNPSRFDVVGRALNQASHDEHPTSTSTSRQPDLFPRISRCTPTANADGLGRSEGT